jgi:hypothetical protein
MACVLLAPDAGPPETFYINQRSFLIPIGIKDPSRRADIKEVVLYVLLPDNKTWQPYGKAGPEKDGIPFSAYDDGAYLCKMAVINSHTNKQEPADIYREGEAKRIVVDTVPPTIRLLSADRQGDEVRVSWDVQEPNPDWTTLKLEYQDVQGGQWLPAAVETPQSGQASFRVNGSAVTVRMSMRDLAKNLSNRPELSIRTGGGIIAAGETNAGLPPLPTGSHEATPAPLPPVNADSGWSPAPPGGTAPAVLTRTTPRTNPDATEAPRPQVVAASGNTSPAPGAAVIPPQPPAPRGPLPPLRMVRKRQITIDYEVTKFGPSGVKSVELYVTRDDGRTWQRSDGDENISPPTAADAQGSPSMKRSLTVDLPADGLYGFYLIVKSGAGLGKPPPQNGIDVPQMRVEVDTTFPQAELFEPRPHATRRDSLVLSWTATDNKFGPAPITIQWAERPDGEWHPIGGGELPNTGEYVWQVPATIPPHVYLQLRVRDMAGNESVAQTGKPVLVDLSEPEVKPLQISVNPR